MSANTLFIGEALLKSRTAISDAVDGKQIKPAIKLAQDMYVQPALGSTLYLRLQAGVEGDNLNNNEKLLLNTYVSDCLVWYTMSELVMMLGYQFFSKGVLQKTAEESNTPSRADLELISNEYKRKAEFYKTRLIQYLKENYTLYYQYLNTGSGLDVIFPENKAYTCPIYLGGSTVQTESRGLNNSGRDGTDFIEVVPDAGVSSFSVPQISGKIVLIATRSGLVKGVTVSTNTDTAYLQIVGSTVTLPTGDVTLANELFTFLYR